LENRMQEFCRNTRSDAHSFSARRLSLLIMLAGMTVFALLDGLKGIYLSWNPQALAPQKADEIALKIADEVDRTPEGATLLVLVSDYDFRELAYAAYHKRSFPGAPDKLPLSAPERQAPVAYKGRCIVVGGYKSPSQERILRLIRDFNSRRPGEPVKRTVVFTWGVTGGVENLKTMAYDENGNVLK